MRIDIKKFFFMGAVPDKDTFYQKAQILGAIEFIPQTEKRHITYPADVERLIAAGKHLQSLAHIEQDTKTTLAEADSIAEWVLEVKKNHGQYLEQRRVLIQEIGRIAPFGNFSMDEIKKIEEETGRHFCFFLAKTSKQLDAHIPSLILINQNEGVDYFVSFEKQIPSHQDLIQLQITEPAAVLQTRLKEIEVLITQTHDELRNLKRFSTLLQKALLHKINTIDLKSAIECSSLELENQLFTVEAWVPITQVDAIKSLADKESVYFEEVLQEETEKTPTYLHNEGISRVGEDVIRIFDVPSNSDKDPSLWVLFAFALFFSMIVFDAGYGLIFLAAAMYIRFKTKQIKPVTHRALVLMVVLALSCTVWGCMTNSFFGITLDPNNFIRKHSLMTWLIEKKAAYHIAHNDAALQEITAKYPQTSKIKNVHEFVNLHVPESSTHYPIASKLTDNILLELALLCGALHIITGLVRYLRQRPVGIGWILFIVGAYLYIPYYLHATSLLYYVFGLNPETSAQFGLHMVYLGVALAGLISVIQHGFAGIFESLHVIQVFGDVLSYLRIYALGTAAYIVAETVNQMASKVPLVLAIFILVFGHLINIILSVMGGTIHGLRLNFLEWYRYSFYGGGKNFQPLQLKSLE